MAGGIRRNSRDSETEAIRAILLSMQDEDLRVRDELRPRRCSGSGPGSAGGARGPMQERSDSRGLPATGAPSIQGQGLPDLAAANRLAIGSRSPSPGPGGRSVGSISRTTHYEDGMGKIRQYDGDGIRVTYDADRCIHAAECVHGLPEVFDPNRKPWIETGAASADDLAAVIRRCPTGALAYERLDGGPEEGPTSTNELRIVRDGPVYATGELVLLECGAQGDRT